MQRTTWRQATLVGLVIFFLGSIVRGAWVAGEPARQVMQDLSEAAGYLKGLVLVVDPGHGGDDPGAVVSGVREKDITLPIALAMKELLEQHGAQVVMTRTEDVDLGGKTREELGKRVALVEQHGAQLYISVHANQDACYCWGAQTFYQKGGTAEGKALAEAIQARLRAMTPTTREALAANYFVLRSTPVPAVVVETGFLSNADERARLQQPDYQRRVATAVVLGIADFRRSTGQSPATEPEGEPNPQQPNAGEQKPQETEPKKRRWWLPPWF